MHGRFIHSIPYLRVFRHNNNNNNYDDDDDNNDDDTMSLVHVLLYIQV